MPYTNWRVATDPIVVTRLDGNTVALTHTFLLDLPSPSLEACEGHSFPQFPAGALLSIGVLCNYGCVAELDAKSILIKLDGTTILQGTRSPVTKLWCIILLTPARLNVELPPFITNTAIRHTPYATIVSRIALIHGAMGFPALPTIFDALNAGYLSSFPEITATLVRKYPLW